MTYALVTVKFDQPLLADPLQEIKKALNLSQPAIDESYGAISLIKGEYVVRIEEKLAHKMKSENHPNIIRVFSDSPIGPCDDVQPKKSKKGPAFGL